MIVRREPTVIPNQKIFDVINLSTTKVPVYFLRGYGCLPLMKCIKSIKIKLFYVFQDCIYYAQQSIISLMATKESQHEC